MSKRRTRKKAVQPNLPEETLARARREAGLEEEVVEAVDDEVEEAEAAEEVEEAPVRAKPTRATSRKAEVAPSRSAEALPPVQRRKRRRDRIDPSQMTQEEIADRLAHPTRSVPTEVLAKQYAYVTSDLRSMWLLAGALFVIMIVAAQVLGH